MLAYDVNTVRGIAAGATADAAGATGAADSLTVCGMRLVLAASVLLATAIKPDAGGGAWLACAGYAAHCVVLFALALRGHPAAAGRMGHWLDICWTAAIVYCTGGVDSVFFLCFCFAILAASFRYGLEEGGRVTVASVLLFIACALLTGARGEFPRLLLRAVFLLALGAMSAHWGEANVTVRRRLALLHGVSRLSNPRFGADHILTSVLERIRAFFHASACLLVVQDRESGACSLRVVSQGRAGAARPDIISARTATPLLALAPDRTVLYSRPARLLPAFAAGAVARDDAAQGWQPCDPAPCRRLAELLEARSFIGVPLSLREGKGWLYLVSQRRVFGKADAAFLCHVAAQALLAVDSIGVLDRIASDAASQERSKIARDLHDVAIQPYIGLSLALSAVRNKAGPDNPLLTDLDRLATMTSEVIADLRRYAGVFQGEPAPEEAMLPAQLRRQAAQMKEFYGIDIAVGFEGTLDINDRLAEEVLHLVSEGLSNIRRHTAARRASVCIVSRRDRLTVRIENEGGGMQADGFRPRSIAQRAAALGGRAEVRRSAEGATVVQIDIPV